MSRHLLAQAENSRGVPAQVIVMGQIDTTDWIFRGVIFEEDGSDVPLDFFIPIFNRLPTRHSVWGTGPSLPLDTAFIGPVSYTGKGHYKFDLGLCGPDLIRVPSAEVIAKVKQCLATGECDDTS
ncbi:hypothetical protein [Parasulfitobacter algicola]|uniref:Uncharacterized protein n=1 Tax=Parasulfitobacter algicola TaxID=2614809 RepID=A0ABX2IWE2_9RHOB|nr:hypothetical protein [Sulfitobacter algicola]NSX54398.1 hypothetical protein [Sulfitobacter algicola]